MPGILVIARMPCKSKEIREEFIKRLGACGDVAEKTEPGTVKYAALVPRDASDETTLYAIEEYADQAALDQHMAKEVVQSLVSWIGTGEVLGGEGDVKYVEFMDGLDFSRAGIQKTNDAYIVVGELDYKPDGVQTSTSYWKAVVETSRNEPGTLVYGIAKDPKNPDKLFTVEGYESERYLWDVHAKSNAVAENVKNTKDLRNGLKHTFLRRVGGYLHKEKKAVANL